jgi:hypothetical protein
MSALLETVLEIKTLSEANRRDSWKWTATKSGKMRAVPGYIVKAQRVKEQRFSAYLLLREQFGIVEISQKSKVLIELTRVATRKLDTDNLRSAFKAVRDGIADYLKIDDGSERLTWAYAQEFKCKTNEIKVRIEIVD